MIADKVAAKNLAPARDAAERYKLLEWLNYITTELHKNLGPMFSPVLATTPRPFSRTGRWASSISGNPARGARLPDGANSSRSPTLSLHHADVGHRPV